MSKDLVLFVIGMSMALFVSFLGMMLAYIAYNKHKRQQAALQTSENKGGISNG